MHDLKSFLAQNAQTAEEIEIIVSPRFKNEKGPISWKLRSLTTEEDESIRKACTKKVQVPGRKGMFQPETDSNQYLGKLVAACVVYPELTSAELQDSYKVMGADQLLKAMLLPGEFTDLLNKVQEINGYIVTADELVDDAKN